MTLRKTALLCGTTLGVVVTLGATGALAQPASNTAAATSESSTDVGEVVVVGTRIRKDTFNTPAPVQIISRDDSVLAGFASATDSLQSTSVTGGGGQINNAFGGFVTQGGPGSNTLGLKGLGASRTLILLNGRRLAPAGTRGALNAPDLNVLPNIVIDHIEILKDGASSIYGSDAVAGVVNVITRRNVQGLEFEGDYHYAEKDAGSSYRSSLMFGHSADVFHIQGSLDFYHRNPLTLADRDWTQCNTDYRFNATTGAPTSLLDPKTGQPKCYPITTTGSNGVTINTLGTASLTGVGALGATGTTFNRWRPNSAVTTGLVGFEGVGGGTTGLNVRDTFEPAMLNRALISPVSTLSLFTEGTYDTTRAGNAQIYFEILGSRRQSSQVNYRQLSMDYPTGSLLIPANLAALPAFSGPQAPIITKGKNIQVRAFVGFGNDYNKQDLHYFKPTLGVRGDLGSWGPLKDWRYDVNYSYSSSTASYTSGTFLTDRLSEAFDVVNAPAGFNPALVNSTGQTCAINITSSPVAGCVPAPFLTAAVIGGQLPQAFRDYVFVPRTGNTDYWERQFTANFDGTLWHLPSGDVQGAIGFEARRQRIDDTPSIDSQRGNFTNLTSAAITRGTDSVWEAYAEIDTPLLTDQPFAKRLDLDVSGRYTSYKSYGNQTTYKATLTYQPVDMLTVRGTIGTSYRAPALFEQYQGASTGFSSAQNDPCANYAASTDPILVANCTSENLPGGGAFNPTSGITIVTAGNTTGNLQAESSKNYTFGVILKPQLPDGWGTAQLAVDYSNITVEDEITQLGGLNILFLCYQSQGFRAAGSFCNLVAPRASGSNALTVLNGYVNIAKQVVRGIDFNFRYVNNIGPGQFKADLLVTDYLQQAGKTFQDDPLLDANGSLNTPKYVGELDLTYTLKPWKLRYELNWIDAMDSRPFLQDPTRVPPPAPVASDIISAVPNYYLHNIALQYSHPTANWAATVGVRNIADRDPPKISTGMGYNRVGNSPLYSGYDYVGRVVYVTFSKKIF